MLKFILINVLLINVVLCQNWCDIQSKYCKSSPHIACQPNSIGKGNCQKIRVVPMTQELKALIVKTHNDYRSTVASGKLPGKLAGVTATRMDEIKWDNDLATVAEFHVKNCKMVHDKCRATEKYNSAGQNLAYTASSAKNTNYPAILANHMKMWFDEYKDVTPDIINKFGNNGKTIGHFTVMVRDTNPRLGCAMIEYEETTTRLWYSQMLTCDYADNNWLGAPVFTVGRTASGCKTISPSYPFLCAS